MVLAPASFIERIAGRGTLSRHRRNVGKKPPAATLVGRSQSQNGTSRASSRRMINDRPRNGVKTIAIGTGESNASENQYRPNIHGSHANAAMIAANAVGKMKTIGGFDARSGPTTASNESDPGSRRCRTGSAARSASGTFCYSHKANTAAPSPSAITGR